ncbi:hypothetical protein M758_6G057400 [Ceratodon purpureus]|nr:hypothetical protein M758_6G057400 [Ceratodon purpureus]KAG0612856.1 hypothetical protein M758_6G057400 [Ceratodon purpureus]
MVRIFRIWNTTNPGLSDDFPGRWALERHPCDGWYGVQCYSVLLNASSSTNYIESLNLESFGIVGELPPDITTLSSLVTLNMAFNEKLLGIIPVELWDMPKLNYVNLSHNHIMGGLQFQQIHERLPGIVDLSYNNFTGRFNVDYVQDIDRLDVSNNFFTGPVTIRALDKSPRWKATSINLNSNNFSGVFSALNMEVRTLDLSNNNFSSFGPMVNTSINKFIASRNAFNGEFPSQIYKIPNLQYMYFDYNNYNGTFYLPEMDYSIPSSLPQFISVAHNNFSSVELPTSYGPSNQSFLLPTYLQFVQDKLEFEGNPACELPETELAIRACKPVKNATNPVIVIPGNGPKWQIIIIIIVSAISVVIAVSIIFGIIIKRLSTKIMALRAIEEEFARKEVKPNLYSYNELKSATKNFNRDNILGKGGFGTVYKGVLQDGTVVAVKHLSMPKQVLHEFLNEIVLITGIRHRNLVKLKGCCLRDDQRLLVYEYIENGDLSDALWSTKGNPTENDRHRLDWPTRFNIILEIAQGLTYLHEDVLPPIIHRDIKAPNILLNREFRPKIADFGLALLFPPLKDGQTHLSAIEIAGTRGYMAPEYASFGQVTTKVDVFSFGVLVLEIVSGRKNVNMEKPSGQQYLLEWVWKLHELERFHELVDKQLAMDRQSMAEIIRVVKVGHLCVQYIAARRPKMSDVVAMLQGRLPLPDISTDYELDMYRGVEDNTPPMGGLMTTKSELGEIVECEEESSLLSNVQPISGSSEAAGWLPRQRNRMTTEITRKYRMKSCNYRDNSTQTDEF